MSYLSKRNALYGGIVAFFFSRSQLSCYLGHAKCSISRVFFAWKPQIEDISDMSKLFSDTERLEKGVVCDKLLKRKN